jgi:uncharacterized membrane protein
LRSHLHWLKSELRLWQADGLITPEQAARLGARYRLDALGEPGGLWRYLISAAGAILIGLGVILLIAYNWGALGKAAKLTIVFGGLVLVHGAAILSMRKQHLLGESLFALGSMLMGAAIFLVGQVYHLDSHYPQAFLLWSLGVVALAWAMPSRVQAWMALILVLAWHLSEVTDFHYPNHGVWILLGLLFPLVWQFASPLLARSFSVTLFIALGSSQLLHQQDVAGYALLAAAMLLICLPGLIRGAHGETAKALAGPAWGVLVVWLLAASVDGFWGEFMHLDWQQLTAAPWLWGLLLASQLAFAGVLLQGRLCKEIAFAELVLLLALAPVLPGPGESVAWAVQVVAFNLLLLGLSLWMMVNGLRTLQRRPLVQGALLFAALVVMRYLDLFDSLVARALVFLVVGAGMFLLGHLYRRNKRAVGA